jgi:hypothetical protein
LILGFLRGVLLGGIIFFGCLIVDNSTLTYSVGHAFSSKTLLSINSNIYSSTYRFLIHPIFPNEEKCQSIEMMIKKNKYRAD